MNGEVRIIGAREAAALLNCDYKSMLAALNRGELPGVRIGRTWKISEKALLDRLGLDPPEGGNGEQL